MPICWARDKRIEHLKRLMKSGTSNATHSVILRGRPVDLDRYDVSIELPCYRLRNARTRPAQLQQIATQGLDANLFDDPDSEEALEIQDTILRGMIDDRSLLKELRNHEQSDPLILTDEGYVVNGNRRLCAMRSLLEENPESYDRFKSVKIVILPPLEESEIYQLEAELQEVPETKAEYSWVATAMKQRTLLENGMDNSAIASMYHSKSSDIDKNIDMLDHAETYLEKVGKRGQYAIVEKMEYAFDEIRKCRKRLTEESERDAFTSLAYSLIEGGAEGRLYSKIPTIQRHLDKIVDGVLSEAKINIEEGPEKDSGIIFDESGDGLDKNSRLARALQTEEARGQAKPIISDIIEQVEFEEKQTKDANYCLKQIQNAHTFLTNALNKLDDSAETEGIEKQLDNILELCGQIREAVNELNNS